MYTIFPWMFDICKNNHKLVCLYAFIFSVCQGGQSFIYSNEIKKDIFDFCRIDDSEIDNALADLISLNAITKTELGYITNYLGGFEDL